VGEWLLYDVFSGHRVQLLDVFRYIRFALFPEETGVSAAEACGSNSVPGRVFVLQVVTGVTYYM
jgi:hypothetical protein